MAQPPPATIDLEGATRESSTPDVLVQDEVLAVKPSQRYVTFVDRGSQDVAVATPDGLPAADGVVGRADKVVDDGVGHRRDDRFDVRVVFSPQLRIDKPVELRPLAFIGVPRELRGDRHGSATRCSINSARFEVATSHSVTIASVPTSSAAPE